MWSEEEKARLLAVANQREAFAKEEVAKENQGLDKFQIATLRFIDTLHGYLIGNHPVTTIDNARAVCELMIGLARLLKEKGQIPKNIELIYERPDKDNEELNDRESLQREATDEMYAVSRKRSNFSKHADRDAGKTFSYDSYSIDHLIFNMTEDYQRLHCALIKSGLLDNTQEQLYPIQHRWLVHELTGYRDLFHPVYSNEAQRKEIERIPDILSGVFKAQLYQDKEVIDVPAGTAACTIFRRRDPDLDTDRQATAEELRRLEVWPIKTENIARIRRDPEQSNKLDIEPSK